VLETLQKVSIIQSTESSNRIEGIEAPLSRIRQLVEQKTTPQNRSEQEIAGYRDVLNTIHSNWEGMIFNVGLVRQLHRDLYKYLPSEGGKWKMADNTIEEIHPDGTTIIRFKPVPAFQTPEYMRDLHDRFKLLWESEEIEPLQLISAYVLDFLCVHPFTDGNGRMARLLTLLLLYQAGYEVSRYISLEMIVDETRDGYYGALAKSSNKWHQGKHSLVPWSEYLLGVIVLGAYREFENRAGLITSARGAKREMVFDTVGRLPFRFQYSDVERSCPGVSRPTINRALAELRDEGKIRCIKSGRDATWEKT
jgi:Fic family protein